MAREPTYNGSVWVPPSTTRDGEVECPACHTIFAWNGDLEPGETMPCPHCNVKLERTIYQDLKVHWFG